MTRTASIAARRLSLLRRVARPWSRALAAIDPRHFYIGLAVVLGAYVVTSRFVDAQQRRTASYDWMLTHRFRVQQPDPDIVLLDIDERSLAAMAGDYGQWPWPRDVLATMLTELEAQGARAVVFDILFSDPDRRNPVSERAFDDAIAKSRIAYFPVLRLSKNNDSSSSVHAGDLAGLVVRRDGAAVAPGAGPTLAMSLPYFASAVAGGHLGTFNIDPDSDSVIRRYRLYEDLGAWRVLSLPARLALDFGWPMPDASEKSLRFNADVLAYRTVSFSDLFVDLLRRQRTRAGDEFRGKIVVIGATASGLFDLKGTPVSRIHPGMDLLATAIDDTKNDRFIDELGAPFDVAIALALLCLMTWLCIRYSHEQLRLAFVVAPGLLFGVSYLTLNLAKTFVDLSAPASIAFVYFSVVKLYSAQVRKRWSEGELFAPLLEPHVAHWVGCLAVSLHPTKRVAGFETSYLNRLRTVAPHVRITSGLDAQTWLGSAFSGVLVATWVEHADDEPALVRDRDEASALFDALLRLEPRRAKTPMVFREETIPAEAQRPVGGEPARTTTATPLVPPRLDLLRALVARTVLQMTAGAIR